MWAFLINFSLVVLAYILTDFGTALYHLLTDKGYNIKSQVGFFRKHHEKPETMTFDLQPMLAGIPIFICGFFFWPYFMFSLGIFVSFAQIPHYYAHFAAPPFVRLLQKLYIILPPARHSIHHSGKFDRDYCVVSGWTNPIVNRIANYFFLT